MKAIIIEEKSFADYLELQKLKVAELAKDKRTADRLGISPLTLETIINDLGRTVHYYFVKWAQGEGASCVRL